MRCATILTYSTSEWNILPESRSFLKRIRFHYPCFLLSIAYENQGTIDI